MKIDPHLMCPAYPNCDEDPLGCRHETSDENLEWYGHRDAKEWINEEST